MFTKNYSSLAGPLIFDVTADFVNKNGTLTTVTLDVPAPGYLQTDNFIITGTTGFADTITTADGSDTITDVGGTSTTINSGAGNDSITIGGTFTSGSIDGGAGTGDDLLLNGTPVDLSVLTLSGLEILSV